MDKDFARDIEFINSQSELPSFVYRDKKIIECLELDAGLIGFPVVLDIGERSTFTKRIENEFAIEVDNTIGDLDSCSDILKRNKHAPYICHTRHDWTHKQYSTVIFSHVIEHLFNPLFCLENIKRVMKPDATLVIATPIKPHCLPWGKGHFHEMDDYRFRKLMDRAGLEIVKWHKFRNGPWYSDLGIRPLLRKLFWKEQSVVILKIK